MILIISSGSIPNSHNVLFLQIFLKRAGKPSSGNTSADFPWIKWAWPGLASATFSGTFSGTLWNLTWLCTKASQTFSGTFSETLLHLTWLCTKASALHQVFLEPCWTWPGSAPKPPGAFSGTFSRTLLTWARPGSAPKPPEPSPEPCWTWPRSAPKPPIADLLLNLSGALLNMTWLCTKASQTFSGTFSGTSLNLTRRLHQCTPELFLAEDPLSLRCWGILDC